MSNDESHLLALIQSLSDRIDKLEADNRELTRNMSKHVKKSGKTIDDLLQSLSPPSISFDEWTETLLSHVSSNLEVVFGDGLLAGINSVLKTNIDHLPVVSFTQKSKTIYYYENDDWKMLEIDVFNNIISRISYRFLVAFNKEWYQPNIEKIQYVEEYKLLYNNYYMKVLGGTRMSDESRCNHVRNAFYNLIKQ